MYSGSVFRDSGPVGYAAPRNDEANIQTEPIKPLAAGVARRAGRRGARRGPALACAGPAALGTLLRSRKTPRDPAQRRDAAPVSEQAQGQQYQPERHYAAGKVFPFRKFADYDDKAGHQPK